jgi:hypothetical protein
VDTVSEAPPAQIDSVCSTTSAGTSAAGTTKSAAALATQLAISNALSHDDTDSHDPVARGPQGPTSSLKRVMRVRGGAGAVMHTIYGGRLRCALLPWPYTENFRVSQVVFVTRALPFLAYVSVLHLTSCPAVSGLSALGCFRPLSRSVYMNFICHSCFTLLLSRQSFLSSQPDRA